MQRLWAFVAQSLSRMGPRQVIVAAVQNVVSSHDSNNKRNGKEFSLPVSSRGPIESLGPLSFNAFERMDFLEFHSHVSFVGKSWTDFECRGWRT